MSNKKKPRRSIWPPRRKKQGPAVKAEPATPEPARPVLQFHPDFQPAGVPATATQVWRTKGGYILDCIQVVPQGDGTPALYLVSRVTLPTLAFAELLEQGAQLAAEERAMVEEREAEAALAASMLACPECPEGNPPRIDCGMCDGTGLVTEDQQDEWAQATMRAMDTTVLGDKAAHVEWTRTGISEEQEAAGLAEGDNRSQAQHEADLAKATHVLAPRVKVWTCYECHYENDTLVCTNCGKPMPAEAVPRSPLLTNRDTGDEDEAEPGMDQAEIEELEAASKRNDAELKEAVEHLESLPEPLACRCGWLLETSWAHCPKCGAEQPGEPIEDAVEKERRERLEEDVAEARDRELKA